jgi:MFS family permease
VASRTPTTRIEKTLLAATATLAASGSVIFALIGNLQDQYGFADIGLGVIAATGFAMSFLVQLLIAPYADRGHTRRLLLTGTLLAVIGNVLFALGDSLWQFASARAVIGAALGCFLPAARALMANMRPDGAAERLGRMAGFELGGFIFGPVVGGLLVGPLGLRWPFMLFSLMGLLSFTLLMRDRIPELPRSTRTNRLALGLLANRGVLVGVLLVIALALPVGVYEALWDRYLTDKGASDGLVGVSLAFYGIPFILLASWGGRLADRFGAVKVALRAMFVVAPATALYGMFDSPWPPIAVGVFEAIAQAAAAPSAQAALAKAAPEGQGAAAQGLAGALNVLTAAVVALLGSWAYGAIGPAWLFTIAGSGVATLGTTAWLLHRRQVVLAPT